MSSKRHATIDDSLVQAAGLRALVSAVVASARSAAPGSVDPREVAARINRTSPYAPSILVDLLFEAAPSELPLLFDVMAATGSPRLRDRIDRILGRGDLESSLRDRLERARKAIKNATPSVTAAGGGDDDSDASDRPANRKGAKVLSAGAAADDDGEESDLLAPTGLSLLRQVFGPRWIAWTSQRVAHHWLEYLHPARQSERQAALAALLDEWRPDSPEQSDILIPVLELESNWGGARLSRWIVRQLGRRPHLQGRALLQRMLHHRDEQVRQLAGKAIDSSPPLVAPADGFPPPRDTLHYCFVAGFGSATPLVAREAKRARKRGAKGGGLRQNAKKKYPPLHGPGTVLLARRAPDGAVRYVLLLLDLDERGIVECWGDDGLSEKEFDSLLRGLERVGVGDPLDRVPAALGLLLANGAAALSLANDFVPPMEYYLWRELFTREEYDARHFNVRLGGGKEGRARREEPIAPEPNSPTPAKLEPVAREDEDTPVATTRPSHAIGPVTTGGGNGLGPKSLDQWHDLIFHSPADLPTKPW